MPRLEEKVYQEQIRLIYNQGPVLVLGATTCAVIIALFLWRQAPVAPLLFWAGAVCISATLRIWVIDRYNRASEKQKGHKHWGPLFWAGTMSAGMIWGAWPPLFYNLYSTETLLLISTVFACMVAVSAASGSIYMPSFLSFSIPLTIPLGVTHLMSDSDSLRITGLLLLLFLAVNAFLAARSNRQFRELIRARFQNTELMDSLEQEKQIAERAVIAKSRFLAAASHDLRQPLHAMGLFLGALKNRAADKEQLSIIEDMSRSSEALNGLLNSLLDVSRLDAEIIDFNPEHVSAREFAAGMEAQFTRQADEKGLSFSINTNDTYLHADTILLERVVRNLLSNAMQYTRQGSVSLVFRSLDADTVRISVADTGIGIPKNEVDEVFSEYYQLNNPERDRSKGLGLGLAIVKRLCGLMGLPLDMQSASGRGTRFDIDVPVGQADMVQPREEVGQLNIAPGFQVLAIDDEEQVLQGMHRMLDGWGCSVILATSKRDALKQLAISGSVPDIILSDYRLRGNESGIDAVATVNEFLECVVPALILSGDTTPERLREVNASSLRMLHKPVSEAALREAINAVLADVDQVQSSNEKSAMSVLEPVAGHGVVTACATAQSKSGNMRPDPATGKSPARKEISEPIS